MIKIFKILSTKHKNLLFISLSLLLSLTFFEILIFSSLQEILNFFNGTNSNNKFTKLFFFLDKVNFKNLLILFFIFFFLRSLIYVILSFVRNRLVQYVNNDISQKIFSNYLKKDFSFFVNTNSSKLISNIILEVDKFAYRTIDPLIYFCAEMFIILGVFLYLAFSYFEGTLLMTLLIFVFYFIFYQTYIGHFQNLGLKKTESDSKKIDDLQKSFYIINEIKIGKLEEFFKKKFLLNTKNSSKSMFALNFFSDMPKAIIELVSLVFIFALLFYSYFWMGFEKKEILSMSGIFVIALFRLLPSANRIYHSLNSIKYHYSSINIIYSELFESKFAKVSKNDNKIDLGFHSIDLKNVSFSYNKENIILDDISLKLNKGKLIGIYGDSGSGKSTLLNLICGLLSPSSGKILYNDKNISDYKESYYDLIGYVSQNIFLIDDTLKNNVVLGDQVFQKDKFLNAINFSNLSKTIEAMKDKENTVLGERGSLISVVKNKE